MSIVILINSSSFPKWVFHNMQIRIRQIFPTNLFDRWVSAAWKYSIKICNRGE